MPNATASPSSPSPPNTSEPATSGSTAAANPEISANTALPAGTRRLRTYKGNTARPAGKASAHTTPPTSAKAYTTPMDIAPNQPATPKHTERIDAVQPSGKEQQQTKTGQGLDRRGDAEIQRPSAQAHDQERQSEQLDTGGAYAGSGDPPQEEEIVITAHAQAEGGGDRTQLAFVETPRRLDILDPDVEYPLHAVPMRHQHAVAGEQLGECLEIALEMPLATREAGEIIVDDHIERRRAEGLGERLAMLVQQLQRITGQTEPFAMQQFVHGHGHTYHGGGPLGRQQRHRRIARADVQDRAPIQIGPRKPLVDRHL
ncbi:hypothetical protein KCV01_g18254, partial [Aureobasidium melanogenum]